MPDDTGGFTLQRPAPVEQDDTGGFSLAPPETGGFSLAQPPQPPLADITPPLTPLERIERQEAAYPRDKDIPYDFAQSGYPEGHHRGKIEPEPFGELSPTASLGERLRRRTQEMAAGKPAISQETPYGRSEVGEAAQRGMHEAFGTEPLMQPPQSPELGDLAIQP